MMSKNLCERQEVLDCMASKLYINCQCYKGVNKKVQMIMTQKQNKYCSICMVLIFITTKETGKEKHI